LPYFANTNKLLSDYVIDQVFRSSKIMGSIYISGVYAEEKRGPTVPLPHEETDQPIIAYRAWGLYNGLLCSVATSSQAWPRLRPYHAVCAKQSTEIEFHESPEVSCACGIYAMRTPEALIQTLHYGPTVLGRIALWGNVVVCEHGYRAEYAYPQLLYYGPRMPQEKVAPVAASYGVECAPMPDEVRAFIELEVRSHEDVANAYSAANSYSQWTSMLGQQAQAQVGNAYAALISVGQSASGIAQAHTSTVSQATYAQMVAQAARSLGISPQSAANIVNQQNHNMSNPPAMQVNTPNGWRIPIWQRSAKKKKP
jgi:hypothetical protein